jgi:hypothetical protein
MIRRSAFAVLAILTFSAQAGDGEADALRLADEVPDAVAPARDWRGFAEIGLGEARLRGNGETQRQRRLSFDLQVDHALTPQWRLVFADRLDASWPAQGGDDHALNTVKEAYLGWRPAQDALLDFGRVNVRHGVATGYNPTDFFRAGALRSVVSIDPASLKENRQGSVMLRGQWLWAGGALTALYSPDLERRPSRDGFNLNVGATNPRDRWLFALSQKIGGFNPQFLIYREEDLPTQVGLNLTGLVNDATVAHVEWSGGRGPSLLEAALERPGRSPQAWRNRLAAGLTHTTPDKLSLTAEIHYNGGGLDAADWNALRQGTPAAYSLYRQWVWNAQEPPTRQALFFRATWQDAIIHRLDLGAMHNRDLVDSSRRTWLEARYHVGRWEHALQWQRSSGQALSNYGALSESRSWQAVIRVYF